MRFNSILVANRGEIACRIMQTAQFMGIKCVAVFVDVDKDAPFVKMADEAIKLSSSYMDGSAIIDAAIQSGAEAIHPGYGFLSENAAFARKVKSNKLIWIGPSPHVIKVMGDKLKAKELAEKSGAMTVYVGEKWNRAMEIARDNRLPYINFVESAGGDLRMGTGKKGDQPPIAPTIGHTHFAATGRYFYDLTELSKMRIPVISIVFGSSTAGGAYQPGMSDYNIFIKDQAKVFLAGPPLVKMATGEVSDDETLGGAKMHSEVSGLSDYLAEDEMDALRLCRNVVSHLHWVKEGPSPLSDADSPSLSEEELLGLVDEELKSPLDIREVIGRIVDGSRFEEFKPLYGKTMICGWSMLHGYPVGILGNNGPIYPESAEKAATFIQLCNKRNIPLIFLQNVTGFLVGKDFERQAIIKKGSQLINAVSNSNVPHITIIIGASFGAGTYAMSGRAYNNRFTFLWPTAKIAVMGSKQIAGVMSIVRRGQAARKGEKFDEKLDAQIVETVEQMSDQMSEGLVASSMVTDDGIIDPRDTRSVIGFCLSIVSNSSIDGAKEYGVFRL